MRIVCKNRSSIYLSSCTGTNIIQQSSKRDREVGRKKEQERERARGRADNPWSPLPLPPLTCKQASATGREGEKRERRLTRFRGLWSIKGLHRNSKTTPAISTNVVGVHGAVGCKCVWVMCMVVCPWMCVQGCVWGCMYASPVAASEQKPQDLASSLVLFFC